MRAKSARIVTLIGARARSDLSQEEIAQRMGMSQPAVARLESGKDNGGAFHTRRVFVDIVS